MVLTERTRIREILFVQDDITLQWHAHQQLITEILADGVVVSAKYGSAEPLSLTGAGDALDAAMVDLANERDAAVAAKIVADQVLTIAQARIAELEASAAPAH